MREHLDDGLAAAEAAALALRADADEPAASAALSPAAMREDLADALDHFDEPRAQAILDRVLAAVTVDTLLSEVVLPYLRELGARWERGEASIAQEHFASGVLRGRLLGIARGWGLGVGPLRCSPASPVLSDSSSITAPSLLHKHTRSKGPFLRRHYPASSVIWPSPTPRLAAALSGDVRGRDPQPIPSLPH